MQLSLACLLMAACFPRGLTVFTSCGGKMREPRGIISTPNFPGLYPTPLSCRWVIEAPADKVIAIYFTQFYMREGLRAAEYAFYSDSLYMGKTDYGTISSDREPTYLVTNKPVLVLDFTVRELGNIHMRVREFLLDVFGFNITYEMIGRNESIKKDACLYHHCSFTGSCFVSAAFDRYFCSCFSDHFGSECQYDPTCGPTAHRNICQNGGICRYYIGSTVRTCECLSGFDGARCERKKSNRSSGECSKGDCTKGCPSVASENYVTHDTMNAEKGCLDKPAVRTRYVIGMRLKSSHLMESRDLILNMSLSKAIDRWVGNFSHAIHSVISQKLEKADNLSVIDFESNFVVWFHFFGTKREERTVRSILGEIIRNGTLGSYRLDQDFLQIRMEVAMSIVRLETSEKMPVVEGTELTLACVLHGSTSFKVEWFKDGYPIQLHTSLRGVWTSVIPKNSKEQFTALLGFDRTHMLDTGIFTCRITDWGFVHNKSILVTIQSAPKPLLTPKTLTTTQGGRIVITCLSQDDVYGNFGYTWLKNGKILNPVAEPEMVEDLFPTGSRVVVREAKYSATYTCIISSSAGASRKDSVVTVLERDVDVPVCLAEESMDIKWSLAAPNTEDVQLCPPGYAGDVRRKCSLKKEKGAVWEEIDFSGCLSRGFLAIKRQSDSLRMGYQANDVISVLLKLKKYVITRRNKMHPGEGEPVVDLLQEMSVVAAPERSEDKKWQIFLDIVSLLLESPRLIRKQSQIVKLHRLISHSGFFHQLSADGQSSYFQRPSLVVETRRAQLSSAGILSFPFQSFSRTERAVKEYPPSWLTDSLELDIGSEGSREIGLGNSTVRVVVVFYRNLSAFFPEWFLTRKGDRDIEYQVISRVISVAIHSEGRSFYPQMQVTTKLSPAASDAVFKPSRNISCGVADFNSVVKFSMDGCQLLQEDNLTLCVCNRPGVYAVLLNTFSYQEEVTITVSFDVIAGIGCAICLFLVFLTLLVLMILWRKIRNPVTVLKLQLCLAIIGAYGTFLKALNNLAIQEYYLHLSTLLQFFLLSTFSLQLCLGLAVYMECLDLRNAHYPTLKIAALGWAVPVIAVGAMLAAESLDGFLLDRWWLRIGSNSFYGYSISVFILILLQCLLYFTVRSQDTFVRNTEYLTKGVVGLESTRLKIFHRAFVVTFALFLVSLTSILCVNVHGSFTSYIFSASSIFLGLSVFLCYTVCSEQHILEMCVELPRREKSQGSAKRNRVNSFRNFVRPEKMIEIAGVITDAEDKRSKLYFQRNGVPRNVNRLTETLNLLQEGKSSSREKNLKYYSGAESEKMLERRDDEGTRWKSIYQRSSSSHKTKDTELHSVNGRAVQLAETSAEGDKISSNVLPDKCRTKTFASEQASCRSNEKQRGLESNVLGSESSASLRTYLCEDKVDSEDRQSLDSKSSHKSAQIVKHSSSNWDVTVV